MNNVSIVGNVGADPECRFTQDGKTIASLRLAIQNGRDSDTDWVDVTFWEKTAQTALDYVRKGHKIGVEGRLKQDRWTDRTTGEQRSKLTVVGNRLHLLTSKADADAMAAGGGTPTRTAPARTGRTQAPAWQAGQTQQSESPYDDSDIPF